MLAGQDPTDARAAAAGLPGVDGVDQWPLILRAAGEDEDVDGGGGGGGGAADDGSAADGASAAAAAVARARDRAVAGTAHARAPRREVSRWAGTRAGVACLSGG